MVSPPKDEFSFDAEIYSSLIDSASTVFRHISAANLLQKYLNPISPRVIEV